MKRRQFLNAATAIAAGGTFAATKVQAQGEPQPEPSAQAGDNTPVSPSVFGFEEVAALAAERSQRVYKQPVAKQVGSFANLNYDQYRGIRFRRDADPLAGSGLFSMDLLPPGAIFYEPVNISVVRDGVPQRMAFDPELLEFDPSQFPGGADTETVGEMGWSGFRLRTVLNRPGVMDEFLVFQGATYFRAVARGTIYGLSARGMAIKTGSPDGEEFPLFTDFWVQEPDPTAEIGAHLCAAGQQIGGRCLSIRREPRCRHHGAHPRGDLPAGRAAKYRHRAADIHVLVQPGQPPHRRRLSPRRA